MSAPASPQSSLLSRHILPFLLVFLIPGFAAWFFPHAERWMDEQIITSVEAQVNEAPHIAAEDKVLIVEGLRRNPPSAMMVSNDPMYEELRAEFADLQVPFATFRWMKWTAWFCLATIGATLLIVGVSVAASLRSQAAQFHSLRVGLPVLQISASIQVLGQAVLVIALSYWVTALFWNVYYPKLVMIAAVLALVGVVALWKAIFSKLSDRMPVEGELIAEAQAPTLWQRARELALKLNTPPPNQIIAGIEPSFFVTEHPVVLGDKVQEGRTLYLSLPMLKVLAADEADAVLGHELAHFSGQDTFWSRKIAPMTTRFAHRMSTLANGIGVLVAHFMHFFWKLYGLSITRLSRQREFRADAVGAQFVSTDAMKRALVKTTAYCDYRHETTLGILKSNKVQSDLNLPRQLEEGYPAFLSSFASSEKAAQESMPHPFDTHPTLHSRLAQLGFDPQASLAEASTGHSAQSSWYHAIDRAPEIEARMWAGEQETLETAQVEDLVWRLVPKTEEEMALVLKHFPRAHFRHQDGTEAMLDYDRIYLSSWAGPIMFKDIARADVDDTLRGQRLTISHRETPEAKPTKIKIYAGKFTGESGDLLSRFSAYLSRHQQADLWSAA